MNRRSFIKSVTVAGGTAALSEFLWAGNCNAEIWTGSPSTPSWINKPMRWAQLTLVEDDPGAFDLRFWLDYFKRTRSDAVCLSAGGLRPHYPAKSPFHHYRAWLDDREACRRPVAVCRGFEQGGIP